MIKIYTDGACSGNPGRGGWAAIIINGNNIEKISGRSENTTNNRMELIAVISALKFTKDQNLEIYTDSKYTKDGIEKWIINWKKNGWKNASKKPVKNSELWKELDEMVNYHDISWFWVKGHSNHRENDIADALANKGIDELE